MRRLLLLLGVAVRADGEAWLHSLFKKCGGRRK